MRLSGKVCIITGTGGSIGCEAARTFAREGAVVVGCDLTVDAAQATVDMVLAAGGTYATDDPNVAIAGWHASGRVIGNGNPYEMSYATFVRFRNGLIANYREYWNPIAFTAAMAGTRFDNSAE